MVVLLVAPYPPFPPYGGGPQRMYQIIRHLHHQHDLHLLTFVPSPAADAALAPLRAYCTITTVPAPTRTRRARLATTLWSPLPDMIWRGRSSRFAAALEQLLSSKSFDVVQVESIEMTQYAPVRQSVRQGGTSLWVYDAFNIEYAIQARAARTDITHPARWGHAAYSLLQWLKLRRYEQQLHRRFGGVFVVSDGDQRMMQALDPQVRTAVVPNGVDPTYFAPSDSSMHQMKQPDPVVLFTGTLDYRANVDALRWFADEVWPLVRRDAQRATLKVVGRNPQAVDFLAERPGIVVVGEVEDVRPYFQEATAYVVPMRIGGGVRLKVLEAWAHALPVVSTTLGVDGIDGFVPDVHALLADQPRAFAQAVLRVLDEPGLRQELGRSARMLVEDRYDWRSIVPRMEVQWATWGGETV